MTSFLCEIYTVLLDTGWEREDFNATVIPEIKFKFPSKKACLDYMKQNKSTRLSSLTSTPCLTSTIYLKKEKREER